MPYKNLLSDLPELYRALFPKSLAVQPPVEAFATCSQCAMACQSASGKSGKFQADKKCCTYFPSLPNYLVGAILSTAPKDAPSRIILQKLIQQRQGVSPAGIFPPRALNALYERAREMAFGRSEALLCPFFDIQRGLCNIWQFRDAVCSTYFCKKVSGEKGQLFWDAVKAYLIHAQHTLSLYALDNLAVPNLAELAEVYMTRRYYEDKLTADDVDRRVSDRDWHEKWRHWAGREEGFFIECYNEVTKLDSKNFERLAGLESTLRLKNVVRRHHSVVAIPSVLRANKSLTLRASDGTSYQVHIRHADTIIAVPCVVIDSFNGQATIDEVIQLLDDRYDISIERDLILALFHAGVLVRDAKTASPS